MKIIVPATPIKIFQRNDDKGYTSSMVAFMIVEDANSIGRYEINFVTISGTQISNHNIAFAKTFVEGAWRSHD